MHTESKQKIAIFLLALILTLNFYPAYVMAEIVSIEARGKDNIKNVISNKDFIVFSVTANINDDSEITPNQVLFGSSQPFSSCNASINGFDCNFRLPVSGERDFVDIIPYTITLKDDQGKANAIKSDSIIVDLLKPEIVSLVPEKEGYSLSDNEVLFTFTITDKACDKAICSDKCSGIDKIEFFDLKGFNESVNIDTDQCSTNDMEFRKELKAFSDGENKIFARAYDKTGKASDDISLMFTIDKTAPVILENSFHVLDKENNDISHFSKNPIIAKAVVNISGSDIEPNKVFGDFTEFGASQEVKGACNAIDDITECFFDITININQAGIKTAKLKVVDINGNAAEESLTKNFELDDSPPEIISLTTNKVVDNNLYGTLKDNIVNAVFKEEGSGLNPQDVKLHFDNSVKNAGNCFKETNWVCTWNDIDFNVAGKKVIFVEDSTDRVGNRLKEKLQKEVIVDSKTPKLIFINVTSFGENAISGFIKFNDQINVRAIIEEEQIKTANADFSKFVFEAKNINGECSEIDDNKFECIFNTNPINIEGFIRDDIIFNFTDVAGNSLIHRQKISVFSLSGEDVDFFRSETTCSPKLLDRETMELISQRAFCQAKLVPKPEFSEKDLTTLSISLGDCIGNIDFFNEFEIFNNEFASREPFIKLNFVQQKIAVNEVNVSCPLKIITKKENEIAKNPEVENINFSFKFYNLPLGELSSNVQKKIDDAVEQATAGHWKLVAFLKNLEFIATRICQLGSIVQNIVAIFKGIGFVLALTESSSTILKPIYEQFRKAMDLSTESMREGMLKEFIILYNKFCAIVNCKFSDDKNYPKWAKFKMTDYRSEIINYLDAGNIVSKYVGSGGKKLSSSEVVDRYMNVKNSIVLSLLPPPCVPGIIHNLDKFRQIQCMYAYCLQTGVSQQGLPVFACEDQKDYATCKYVVGEAFKIIPIVVVFDYWLKIIKSTLSNPLRILGLVPGFACQELAISPEPWAYHFCSITKIVSMTGNMIDEVKGIYNEGVFKTKDDYCKLVDKVKGREKDTDVKSNKEKA